MFASTFLSSVRSRIRKFRRNDNGSIIILSAIMIPVFILALAGVVELTNLMKVRSKLAAAADAAVLAAVIKAKELKETEDPPSDREIVEIAKQEALKLFAQLPEELENTPEITVTLDGTTLAAVIDYNKKFDTLFSDYIEQFDEISGTAESIVQVTERAVPYMEVDLLLDVSSSMGIGATVADQYKMRFQSKLGCTFACHNGHASIAHSVGAKLRIDVLQDSVGILLDAAKKVSTNDDGASTNIKIAVNTFDYYLTRLLDMTSDLDKVTNVISKIRMKDDQAGTEPPKSMLDLSNKYLTAGGNGEHEDDPKKFVFLVTDGTRHGYLWDPEACDVIKSKNITMGVIYVEYNYYIHDSSRGNTLVKHNLPIYSQIPVNMKKCASENYYLQANTPEQIEDAMSELFEKALYETQELVRLSK